MQKKDNRSLRKKHIMRVEMVTIDEVRCVISIRNSLGKCEDVDKEIKN